MLNEFNSSMSVPARPSKRVRSGNRTLQACDPCKDRKLKCDDKVPSCGNCLKSNRACLVQDPFSRQSRPRNYVETLETRVAVLESLLKSQLPSVAYDHLQDDNLTQEPCSSYQQQTPRPEHMRMEPLAENSPERVPENKIDQHDGYDELSSRVGLLSLNAAGAEPHYLGVSSTFAFARLISSSLRRSLLSEAPDETRVSQDAADFSTASCKLPRQNIALQLSNAYFQNIHIQYPFLQEIEIRSWEDTYLQRSMPCDITESDEIPLFFLNMVYAIGALLMPGLGQSPEGLYMSAQRYSEAVLARDGLESTQAILSCALYSLRSSSGTSQWKLAGLALRQCIDLGYHRNSKYLETTESTPPREIRQAVFWCAYVMESQASIMLGRPPAMPPQDIDAEYLPSDIARLQYPDNNHETSNILADDTTWTLATNRRPGMERATHTFRIRFLMSRIHYALYSRSPSCCRHVYDTRERIRNFRQELEVWRASIPLMTVSTAQTLSLFATTDWFHLEFDYALLQLYRVLLVDPATKSSDPCFEECFQAAKDICNRYRTQFVGKPTSYTWMALHELFLAGMTYIHCLWTSTTIRVAQRQSQVSSVCNSCTIVLVIMAERWSAAAPYRDLFERLSNKTLLMLEEESMLNLDLRDSLNRDESTISDWVDWERCIDGTDMSEIYGSLLTRWTHFSSEAST